MHVVDSLADVITFLGGDTEAPQPNKFWTAEGQAVTVPTNEVTP